MKTNLSIADLEFILTSLSYTKLNFESTSYPTYELKQEQMKKLENVIEKIRKLKGELKVE